MTHPHLKQVADEEMARRALGDEYDPLSEPPNTVKPEGNDLWPAVRAALQQVYDPEIPVNVYELGLIYKIEIAPPENGVCDVTITMTLTSPACPVAQEMPEMVRNEVFPLESVGEVSVDIVWDPAWDPSHMAETAKLQLNMFY